MPHPAVLPAPSEGPAAEFRRSWPIVALGTLGTCFSGSGILWYSFGVLIAPLHHAYGWSSAAISGWATFFSLGCIVGLPAIGQVADRIGVRPVVLAAIPLLGLSVGLGGLVTHHIWKLYLVAAAAGAIGAGAGSLTYSRAINGWFSAGRGRALGFMSAGIGLGAMFGPHVVEGVVAQHGLFGGFCCLGCMMLIPLPLMALFLHERREAAGKRPAKPESGYTRREAMRRPVFWLLCASGALWTLCTGGNFHLVPYMTSSGLRPMVAANYVGLLGLTAMIGRVVTGFVIDRLHAPYVCACVFLIEASAFVSLALINPHLAYLPILAIGLAHGAEVDCFTYCTARYFGLRSYGVLFGLFNVMTAVGNGLGPPLFGWVRDTTGSYAKSFCMDSGFAVAAALLLVVAGRIPFFDASHELP